MDLTPEQFARLGQYFDEAVNLPQSEREALMERVRRDEGDEMANQLAIMLKADEPTNTMDAPPGHLQRPAEPEEACAFREGEVVLGRFRIVRMFPRGGMGEVYEAHDQELGPVALKTIRRDLIGDRGLLRRFKQEVHLGKQVTSQYVCRIHELFILPDKGHREVAAFLTMELLKGTTLAKRIAQGPLPWSEAEPITIELCHGLDAIHAAGMVHRDFKPGNVMLARRGNVTQAVITDFGLALRPEESPHLTRTGGFVGTLPYMAPEQFGGKVSPATDIYALGAVLYEMATGKQAFDTETPPAQRRRPPAASSIQPGVPRRVDRVIDKCLEPEPANRFQTATEVARALRGEAAEAISLPMPSWATGPRRWLMAAVLALALAALTAVGILAPRLFHPPYKPNDGALDWYTKGLVAFRQGTYLSAQVLFQSALEADKEYGLARVHLAEAWNELDFKGNADERMREVTREQEDGMSTGDRDYAEAVRATLSQDFKGAVDGFKRVLKDQPEEERAAGNVDVGRIEEKAGNIAAALEAYHTAIRLAPNSPAAYLRSAVLESRHGEDKEAKADFEQADQIFAKLGALEGRAEVAYQRSYWESILGHYDAARALAEQSMHDAPQMPEEGVQLQVRAMCRLSAIAHGKGQDDKALEEAEKAIALAHHNELEYWETDARLRQGAAYYGRRSKGDVVNAETCAMEALNTAKRRKWPRLIALAEVNLASVRDARLQNQNIDELTAALDYYKKYQFPRESLYPLLFLVREKNNQSEFEGARRSGIDLLSLARNSTILAQAEEAVGKSYLGLQQYPEALAHFGDALETAKQSNDTGTAPYEMLYSAEALASLGRFEDAKHLLEPLKDEELDGWPSLIRARLLSMQLNYADVLKLTRRTLAAYPGLTPGTAAEFRITGLIAAAKTGDLGQAKKWAHEATGLGQQAGDPEITANVTFAQAVLDFKAGSLQEAKSATEVALTFFQAHGQKESEWLTQHHLALIEKALGSKESARLAASKSLDILSVLEHNWGAPAKRIYEDRPDVSAAAAELHQIVEK